MTDTPETDPAESFAAFLVQLLTGDPVTGQVWIDKDFPTDLHVHTVDGKRFYIKVEEEA